MQTDRLHMEKDAWRRIERHMAQIKQDKMEKKEIEGKKKRGEGGAREDKEIE